MPREKPDNGYLALLSRPQGHIPGTGSCAWPLVGNANNARLEFRAAQCTSSHWQQHPREQAMATKIHGHRRRKAAGPRAGDTPGLFYIGVAPRKELVWVVELPRWVPTP